MILVIALDSYDTPFAGCTTHFSSLLLHLLSERGYEPLDYPWLVRLNPAVPWKTRGNGAVVLHLRPPSGSGEDAARKAEGIIQRLAEAYAPGSGKAGYVVALYSHDSIEDYLENRPRCLLRLYRRAVHDVVAADTVEECLREARGQALRLSWGGGRGIVGAAAAMGMSLEDYTFELTVYRRPENWGWPRRIDKWSVVRFDLSTRPATFLNMCYAEGRPLIAPHGPDPVLYAVRGEEPGTLMKALDVIDAGEEPSHWVLHRTNQATDAHLRWRSIRELRPYTNPLVEGVLEDVKTIKGGHAVARLCSNSSCVNVAFYRETGDLRLYAQLLEGSRVLVGGQLKPHREGLTLNAELLAPRGGRGAGAGPALPPLLRPPPRSFHHLMRPAERRGSPGCPPGHAPCTSTHSSPKGFTSM